MPHIQSIKATYQIVKLSVPNTASNAGLEMVNQFEAPPGFRLHSVERIKDTTLLGQPHQFLLLFEHMAQVVEEVPDDHPAVIAAQVAGHA